MRAAKFFILVIVACASLSFAQQTGRITGVVVDPNDARIVGATVRIENGEFRQTKRTDSEGKFELKAPEGLYDLTIEQSGFRKFRMRGFRVDAPTHELGNIRLYVATPPSPVKVVSGR